MLSVVIPCRNAAADVGAQLEALARQEVDRPFEVVISDNGSTDATRDVAGRYSDRLDLRIVDSSERTGRAFACNAGVEGAAGDRIAFVDADDEVAPGYVAAMTAALDTADFVAARLDCVTLNRGWVAATRDPFQVDALIDVLNFLPFAIGCSLGVTRKAFDSVGGFTEDVPFAEDVELCWRLQLAGTPLVLVPDAVLRYRYRDTLPGLYRQSRGYGLGQAALYRKFATVGMRARPTGRMKEEWWWLFRKLPTVRTRAGMALWVHMLGYRMGRLRGSLRYRVFYL